MILDQGSFRFLLHIEVGTVLLLETDANISVIATLLGKDNEPLGLLAGTAICISRVNKKNFSFLLIKEGVLH